MILCTLDVMAWRAIKNALAGLITGLAGGILLLGLLVIWGSALFSLIDGPGGWEHATLYVAAVVLIPVVLPWLVQGLTSLQRSRLLATLDIEIVLPARTPGPPPGAGGPGAGHRDLAPARLSRAGPAGRDRQRPARAPVPGVPRAGPVVDADRRAGGPEAARADPPREADPAGRVAGPPPGR